MELPGGMIVKSTKSTGASKQLASSSLRNVMVPDPPCSADRSIASTSANDTQGFIANILHRAGDYQSSCGAESGQPRSDSINQEFLEAKQRLATSPRIT